MRMELFGLTLPITCGRYLLVLTNNHTAADVHERFYAIISIAPINSYFHRLNKKTLDDP